MRMSRLFAKTLRQAPSEADTISHQLLLRAGLVQQLAAGIYSYLPLGWRVLRKVEDVIRQEMDEAGGQEIQMPAIQPIELWEASGRREAFGENLFVLTDRRDRELALGPTHEEVVVDIFKRQVQSYRDLPVLPYQIQTKFRDEARPRGGLIRLRQFVMKDLYSFDADWDGLDTNYDRMAMAYKNIFDRCRVPTVMVLADSGAIGGRDCHEFMFLTEVGEDEVLICPNCGYAANAEKAAFLRKAAAEEPLVMEEVSTPGAKTIEEVSRFLGVPREKTLKAVFYASDGQPVFVAIRGDMDVNETKLRNTLGSHELRLMEQAEVQQRGLVAGSASPVGLKGVTVVADDAIPASPNLVAGANTSDAHLRNVNYGRDWQADIVTDIALAHEGDPCPTCGTAFKTRRSIEMGHIFKLGTVYSDKLGATFLDGDGQAKPAIMGCYGIGVERLLAAVLEQNHDDRGIVWPRELAPFDVHLVVLGTDRPEVVASADALYDELRAVGVEALYDDREESAGVKFNDADLLGMPVRLTVSPRNLEKNSVELKRRTEEQSTLVPKDQVVTAVRQALGD